MPPYVSQLFSETADPSGDFFQHGTFLSLSGYSARRFPSGRLTAAVRKQTHQA
jgi:hypothetical protein